MNTVQACTIVIANTASDLGYQSLSRLAGYEAGFDSSTIMISIGAFSAFDVPVTVNLVSKFDAPTKALVALFDEANGTP
jgi:hypothetical protein